MKYFKSNYLRLAVVISIAFMSFLSCSEKSDNKLSIDDGKADFSGVYLRWQPGSDDVKYIVADVSPYRYLTKNLFKTYSVEDLVNSNPDVYITARHNTENPLSSLEEALPKGQYMRLLYYNNVTKSKWLVMRPGILDGQMALRSTERDAAFDKEYLADENNWFIIHDFTDYEYNEDANGNTFREVAIESYKERGYFLMDEGTTANAIAIRLMKQDNVLNATRWSIYKP